MEIQLVGLSFTSLVDMWRKTQYEDVMLRVEIRQTKATQNIPLNFCASSQQEAPAMLSGEGERSILKSASVAKE